MPKYYTGLHEKKYPSKIYFNILSSNYILPPGFHNLFISEVDPALGENRIQGFVPQTKGEF